MIAARARPQSAWDPVHDGRAAFRVCLGAICQPGIAVPGLPRGQLCAEPILDRAAAILLALLDPGLTLAVVGGPLAEETAGELRRQTGARPAPVSEADFVLVSGGSKGAAAMARRGTALRPETGATLVYAVDRPPVQVLLTGPGIEHGSRTARVALPDGEREALIAAAATPPCGLDAFVLSPAGLIGLPRSVLRRGSG